MTEAELVESITSYFDIAVSGMALYLTACSGYLIVAYLVGKKTHEISEFHHIDSILLHGECDDLRRYWQIS